MKFQKEDRSGPNKKEKKVNAYANFDAHRSGPVIFRRKLRAYASIVANEKFAYASTDRKLGPARLRAGRQTGTFIELLTGQKRTEVRFNPIYSMQSRF